MDKLMEEEQLFKAMGLEDMDSEEIAKNHTIIDFLKVSLFIANSIVQLDSLYLIGSFRLQ